MENLIEDNKLICEFIGDNLEAVLSGSELVYQNWEEIMRIVDEIEKNVSTFQIETITYSNGDKDYVVYCSYIHRLVEHDSKLKVVFKAVVKYIKWYNKNKL
jgi:hypothetical protein